MNGLVVGKRYRLSCWMSARTAPGTQSATIGMEGIGSKTFALGTGPARCYRRICCWRPATAPTQYLWIHRRFKRRPDGTRVYD